MRAPSTFVIVLGLAIGGCSGGCSGPSSEEGAARPATTAARAEVSGGEGEPAGALGAERAAPVPVEEGEPPVLRMTGTPVDRRVAIRVENRGATRADLRGRLTLQRREGERWEDARVALELRFSCEEPAAECVTLAPGASLLPPEWLGTIGDAQCVCTRCGPAPAGTYRLVARSCGGAHTLEGEPFELTR